MSREWAHVTLQISAGLYCLFLMAGIVKCERDRIWTEVLGWAGVLCMCMGVERIHCRNDRAHLLACTRRAQDFESPCKQLLLLSLWRVDGLACRLPQGSTALTNPLRASTPSQVGQRPVEGSPQGFGTLPVLKAHV